MIGYGPDPYKITNVPAALAALKATGANAMALAPIWFMDEPQLDHDGAGARRGLALR